MAETFPSPPPPSGLSSRFLADAQALTGRAWPPVERWHPPFCGDIDMKIMRDGRWFYLGTPINRQPLVKLFASILRKDADRHVLVTPVECVGILVEDAPFLAVEMEIVAASEGEALVFRTNLDEVVVAGPGHPLRFELEPGGGLKPYILIRGGLWARLTRALTFDLAERIVAVDQGYGIWSKGQAYFLPEGAAP